MKPYNHMNRVEAVTEGIFFKLSYGVRIDIKDEVVMTFWRIPAKYVETAAELGLDPYMARNGRAMITLTEPINMSGIMHRALMVGCGNDAVTLAAANRIHKERINEACFRVRQRKESAANKVRAAYWKKRAESL